MKSPLYLVGHGVHTAAGTSVGALREAIDRGATLHRPTRVIGLDGHPVRAATALPMPLKGPRGLERLLALCRPAIAACLGAHTERPLDPALILCTAERPEGPKSAAMIERIAALLADEHRIAIPARRRFVVEKAHAGGMIALSRARVLLLEGAARSALVVGVDSLCDPFVLRLNDAARKSKSSRAPEGFVPGEAAAALWLAAEARGPLLGGWSFSEEPVTPPGHAPSHAALREAANDALAQWRGETASIAEVFADLNGDPARALSVAAAMMEALWRHGAMPPLILPAAAVGDVGAATTPLLFALAAHGIKHAPAPRLVLASSPGSMRGAALLAPLR